jgi:hypothetical protein
MFVPVTYAQPAAPAVPLVPIEFVAGGTSPGPSAASAGAAQFGLATPGPTTPTPTTIVARRRKRGAHRLALSRSSSTQTFVQCVTMRESSMRWHIVDPPYSGGDQWTASAWQAAGGARFAPIAAGATPEQQIWVFERYEPSHPGAWPVTVPACS